MRGKTNKKEEEEKVDLYHTCYFCHKIVKPPSCRIKLYILL